MVLTSWPSAITASVVQDLTALPSRWTTQAPHWEVSQPTWVPVNRRFSRRNCTSRVRGSTLPFTIREIFAIQHSLQSAPPHCTAGRHFSCFKAIIWVTAAMSNHITAWLDTIKGLRGEVGFGPVLSD